MSESNNDSMSIRSKMQKYGLDIFKSSDLVKASRTLQVKQASKTLSQTVQSSLKKSK